MPNPSIQFIEDLTSTSVELLTQLLSLAPGRAPTPEWLQDQLSCLSTLPQILLRPDALLPRIAMSLPFTPQKAHLCKIHKPLSPYLIRRIFLQVSAECATRVARLEEHPCLPENLAAFVKRLHTINSLWMSPELYRAVFNATPFDQRFDRVESGCEACILATIGGNCQILSDLRASMLGRRKKRAPVARLLKVLDAWIDWTGRGDEIREESDDLSREIRSCRRQLQHARRQKRRNIAEGILEDITEEEVVAEVNDSTDAVYIPTEKDLEAEDEHDFEGSIINEYAKRWSRSIFPMEIPREDAIHPAFRNSLCFDAPSGTFTRRNLQPEPLRPHRPQSQCTRWPGPNHPQQHSISSASAYETSQRSKHGLQRGASSEDQAEAYRNLAGVPEAEEELDGRRARRQRGPSDGGWI